MHTDFWIKDWHVQPDLLKITGRGQALTVKPRSMAVLVELAGANGEVVSREQLIDRVWKGALISDDVLTQSIVELRRALGDDARHPEYIETIKRIGIRLIPEPAYRAPEKRTRHLATRWGVAALLGLLTAFTVIYWPADPEALPAESSIAVLPFTNLSDDDDNGYFADGLTEEIIALLAETPGLKVSARTSSFAYRGRDIDVREIGSRLNVANVLEGSVRRDGNRIRVTAQLIDVENGYHHLSRSYEYELDDAFAIQREIAAEVLAALAPRFGIGPNASTTNGLAYDHFLAGKQRMHLGRFGEAAGLFADAVAADNAFALAHANLAIAITSFHENAMGVKQAHDGAITTIDTANRALERARELGLRHADLHLAEASIAAYERNLDAEALALERAIELNPLSVDARMKFSGNLAANSRFAEALAIVDDAAAVDPLNAELAVHRSALLSLLSGYEAGIEPLRQLVDLDLESPLLWGAMAELAATWGRYEDRVGYARHLNRVAPGDAWAMAHLGDAYTELGEFSAANDWIASAERISPTEALKARARWLGATGDWIGFSTLIRSASLELGPLPTSSPLTPAQSALSGLFALERGHAGDHTVAISLLRRMKESSPTLPRRSPYVPVFVSALLGRELKAINDVEGLAAELAHAQSMLDDLQHAGIRQHPWLTMLQAVVYALGDDDELAEDWFLAAIDQGWRAWELERHGVARPLGHLIRPVETLERELALLRERIRTNGMVSGPSVGL